MSSFELPLHVFLNGDGLVSDLRRLIPVSIADPNFRFRRYSSGIIPRPSGVSKPPSPTGGSADVSPFVMLVDDSDTGLPYRNIYWPTNVPGTVHVRLFAVFGATSTTTTVPVSFGMESWRINGVHLPPFDCLIALPPNCHVSY